MVQWCLGLVSGRSLVGLQHTHKSSKSLSHKSAWVTSVRYRNFDKKGYKSGGEAGAASSSSADSAVWGTTPGFAFGVLST